MISESRNRNWLNRLAANGITPAQFLFQLLIVTAGVYIAILVQDRAENRGRQRSAQVMLNALGQELVSDERSIQEIIASQEQLQSNMDKMAADARNGPPDTVIATLLASRSLASRTFFFRRAAYASLLSSGNLQYIDDPELRLRLAQVYEQDYSRLEVNGDLADQIYQGLFHPTLLRYWDHLRQRPIPDSADAAIQLSNACLRVKQFSIFYVELLREQLNTLRDLRGSVESHVS
jgi:hypothetical protein